MRYGVIRTTRNRSERNEADDPVHWLRRGTLVRILRSPSDKYRCVETMYPVFGSRYHPLQRYAIKDQVLWTDDLVELPRWLGPFLEWFAPRFQRAREWLGWA